MNPRGYSWFPKGTAFALGYVESGKCGGYAEVVDVQNCNTESVSAAES